jgi:hypothetical protein
VLSSGSLAVGPRHFLDDDGLTAAEIEAPHRVQQKTPERNEPPFGELIVPGGPDGRVNKTAAQPLRGPAEISMLPRSELKWACW